jgi:hypothetical protein
MLLIEIYLENLTLFYLGFYLCIGWDKNGRMFIWKGLEILIFHQAKI